MRSLLFIKTLLVSLGVSLTAQSAVSPFSDLNEVRRAFLNDHRVFEKVVEGRSDWDSAFCHGVYSYRILLRTQLRDLDIQLDDEGSIVFKAVLNEPYIGFQGNYQGAYSFCFPISNWSGLTAESATITAKIEFKDTEEGRILVNIKVNSVELGMLKAEALSEAWNESMTQMANQGLTQIWSSNLGEWFSSQISSIVNEHLPSLPKENET